MSEISLGFKDLDVKVEYDYQPEEPQVRYYKDDSGYPGCDASLEVSKVFHQGVDITAFFENVGLIYDLESEILELLINKE